MKILTCPINGPRPIQEFTFGGEVREMPNPSTSSDEQWADYIFNRAGEPAVKREWWFHMASNTWFIAERDNMTDEVIRTFLYDKQEAST
jgi:sarcosine oxidase subunit delta